MERANKLNPLNDHHLGRLQQSIYDSRRQLEPFRSHRYEAIRQMVGKNYSDNGAYDHVPVNFLEMAVFTYARHLVANNPAALVSTPHSSLKPMAYKMELALKQLIKEMNFADTLYDGVVEAIFCLGIVKTGVTITHQQEIAEYLHDITQPFADVVNLDDWVHDMTARKQEHWQYAGNRYRLPLELVQEMDIFDPDVRDTIVQAEERVTNEQGDVRSETISQGEQQWQEEFKEHTELWDIWLPQEGLLLTFPSDKSSQTTVHHRPLRTVEWDGPEGGPYHLLSFSKVPGNMMPLSPIMIWRDLAEIGNRVFNKMTRQSDRQKTLGLYQRGASETAERIKSANDGELVGIDDPKSVTEARYGGVDAANSTFFLQIKELFSYMAGNLDLLSGLGPQSGTLGQDQLLAASANRRVGFMQERVVNWTEEILRSVAWYEWTDPLLDRTLTINAGYDDIQVQEELTSETREGDFLDFKFNISPYSMHPTSPQEKLQKLQQVMQQYIIPFAQQLPQQGIQIDFEALLRLVARYMDMDEIEEILDFEFEGMGEEMSNALDEDKSSKVNRSPIQTTRNYNRSSSPQSKGADSQMMNKLLQGLSGNK